jgi:quercetin dioxygenase-like cupin family protein
MTRAGRFDDLDAEEPYPGVRRRTVQGEHATVAEYTLEPGASFPLHSHPQEQVTLVLEGEVELTADGRAERLAAGAWSVVPGGVPHGVRAGADGARIVAVVVPRRDVQP